MTLEVIAEFVRDWGWLVLFLLGVGWLVIRDRGEKLWGKGQNVSLEHFDQEMSKVHAKLDEGSSRMSRAENRVEEHRERIIRLETAERIRWQPMERGLEKVGERLDQIHASLTNLEGRMEGKADR